MMTASCVCGMPRSWYMALPSLRLRSPKQVGLALVKPGHTWYMAPPGRTLSHLVHGHAQVQAQVPEAQIGHALGESLLEDTCAHSSTGSSESLIHSEIASACPRLLPNMQHGSNARCLIRSLLEMTAERQAVMTVHTHHHQASGGF